VRLPIKNSKLDISLMINIGKLVLMIQMLQDQSCSTVVMKEIFGVSTITLDSLQKPSLKDGEHLLSLLSTDTSDKVCHLARIQ